ncbi:MAG: hypothetical protein IPM74_13950 [Crocinitomicaceae bacterium]|nr:hypothetical protein [Crocinitomicaceae bacterium]MBK8926975.1 hypothetical protein [Crocinitomicaceae bacterium]
MKSRRNFIIAISWIVLGCDKQVYVVDEQDVLVMDTASFIVGTQYISHTATELELDVDIVTLIGDQSISDYSAYTFVDSSLNNSDLSFTQTSSTVISSSAQNYSTILLIDRASLNWHRYNYTGHYMERYFNSKALSDHFAMAIFEANDYNSPDFICESAGDMYGNTSSFNIQQFYHYTETEPDMPENNQHTPLFILTLLDRTLDSLIASPNSTGNRSITLLTGNRIDGPSTEPDFTNFITKAQSNNVSINIICDDGSGMMAIQKLVHYTGGFVFDNNVNRQMVPGDDYEHAVYGYGVYMQNLDNVFQKEYTFNRCRLLVSSASGNFFSGSDQIFTLAYGGHIFRNVGVKIP